MDMYLQGGDSKGEVGGSRAWICTCRGETKGEVRGVVRGEVRRRSEATLSVF